MFNRRNTTYAFKLFTFLLVFSGSIFAQGGKGKLSGQILDDATGEPLIGVNVVLEDTRLGGTTDIEGNYFILNVQPGKYSVSASMVGYGKLTQTGVEVSIDRTTQLNFRLKDKSVQVSQVTIVAEKPKVVKDQTSTTNTMDAEQIKSAPIEGIRGAMDLSASFQKDALGNYSVRGSGSNEVNFQVNGISQNSSITNSPAGGAGSDKADNSWKYDVNPLAVQQIQVISGGFSAEYGNAQAGVVKVALKDGTPKLSGEMRFEYRPTGQYHYGNYVYDKNSNFEWQTWGQKNYWTNRTYSANGPLYVLNAALYKKIVTDKKGTAADSQKANSIIDWAYNLWVKNHEPSEENILGAYDYREHTYKRYMVGFGGPLGKDPNLLKFYFAGEYRSKPTKLPTPEKDQVYQNYTLNLTYQPFKNHKFKGMLSFQKYKGGIFSGSDDIRYAGLSSVQYGSSSSKYRVTLDPVRIEQTIAEGLTWIYTITPKSFLETTVTHQLETYEIPYISAASVDMAADRADSSADPSGTLLARGPWYDEEYTLPYSYSSVYYADTKNNYWSYSSDYTNQITQTNMLKAGIDLYYWELKNNAVNSSYQANTYMMRSGFAEYYEAYPYNYAFYIQDKMEYEGMIANVGVRLEGYNFQSNVPVDKFNIFYPGTSTSNPGNPATTSSKSQFIVLPRLGVSFPVNENTVFRFQYGHFASMPTFAQAYAQKTNSGWNSYGNPDLDYKKTIQYEVGVQQVVDDNNRLDVSVYYNDRVSQTGTIYYASMTGSSNSAPLGSLSGNTALYPYSTTANNAFGSTVGLEVIFEKFTSGNWGYRLSYNLSQTKAGNYGSMYVYPNGVKYESKSYTGEFLSGNDRTHNFRGYVQYQFMEEEGLKIFGIYPFANSLFGVTYTAQSGVPFTYATTYQDKNNIDVNNNWRYPLESNIDLNFQKTINFAGMKLLLGVRVMNMFNNKWLTPISVSSEVNYWIQKGVTTDNTYNIDVDAAHRKMYRLASYKTYKNTPRQIYFTLGIGF